MKEPPTRVRVLIGLLGLVCLILVGLALRPRVERHTGILARASAVESETPTAAGPVAIDPPVAPPTAPLVRSDPEAEEEAPIEPARAFSLERPPEPEPEPERTDPPADLDGVLNIVGSETMAGFLGLAIEGFQKAHPGVSVSSSMRGSVLGPPALTEGVAQFAAMSRRMADAETSEFERVHGHQPTAIVVAIDLLAVYVPIGNPLRSLDLPQLDAIFSTTRKMNHPEPLTRWDQLGLDEPAFRGREIKLFGRSAHSGDFGFFRSAVLGKGDYREGITEGSPGGVVRAIGQEAFGIGYASLSFAEASVRALPLARRTGDEPVAPGAERAYDGSYPLARPLFLYLDLRPGEALDDERAAFVRWLLGQEGRDAATRSGLFPINDMVANRMLSHCGLEPLPR